MHWVVIGIAAPLPATWLANWLVSRRKALPAATRSDAMRAWRRMRVIGGALAAAVVVLVVAIATTPLWAFAVHPVVLLFNWFYSYPCPRCAEQYAHMMGRGLNLWPRACINCGLRFGDYGYIGAEKEE